MPRARDIAQTTEQPPTYPEPVYAIEQIGGGPRRSPTPVLQTPSRLRPRPPRADGVSNVVRKGQGRRPKSGAAAQTSAAKVSSDAGGSTEGSQSTDSMLINPSNAPRALPPLPPLALAQPTGTFPPIQPSLPPSDDPGHRTPHPILVPSTGLNHPSLASNSRYPSALSIVPPSSVNYNSSLGPPSRPPSTVPPSRPPSTLPASYPPSTVTSSTTLSSIPPSGPSVTQAARILPAPPAGPRKPSGSYSQSLPSNHELPFTHETRPIDPPSGEIPSSPASVDVITVRPIIHAARVIPPTPQEARPSSPVLVAGPSDPTYEAGDLNNDVNVEMDSSQSIPSTPSTPSGGRRSAETLALLEAAYVELDTIVDRVSRQVSLTHQQIVDSWNKSRGRIVNGVNHWNIYQAYFKAHEEQERGRLDVPPDEPSSPSVVSRAYKQFIIDHGDVWKDILEIYELTEMTKTNQTIAQRTQTFNRFCRKICDMLDTAANRQGFEAAIVLCGNIVNEDASLGYSHTTPSADEFWETRCRACPDTIIGHLKAHVYNIASLQVVEDAFAADGNDGDAPGANIQNPAPAQSEDKTAENAAPKPPGNATKVASRIAAPPKDLVDGDDSDVSLDNSVDPTAYIKSSITRLISNCRVDTTKLLGGNFPWKTLIPFLVDKGLVIEGYPFDVPMPGQSNPGTTRTKGLNNLSLPQKRILASALRAKKVTIRRVAGARELAAIVSGQLPVITEEAPPQSSHYSRGRQMFRASELKHTGLPRLPPSTASAATRIKKRSFPSYIEISDGSSPGAVIKHLAGPSRRTKSSNIPVEMRSDNDGSDSEASEVHDGGNVLKKRKAATLEVPSEHAAKKRAKSTEVSKASKVTQVKKGKARAIPLEEVIVSSDEELVSGNILPVPSSNESSTEAPKSRPKPRVIHRKVILDDEDVFQASGPSRDSECQVSESLKKQVQAPADAIPTTPPSPSPKRPQRHTSDEPKVMHNPPTASSQPPSHEPSAPASHEAPAPGPVVHDTDGKLPVTQPDQQRLPHPPLEHSQPPAMGSNYFFPNGAYPPPYPHFFGAPQGMFYRPGGYHDGQNSSGLDSHDPYGMAMFRGGNLIGHGMYPGVPGADAMGQPSMYPNLNYPELTQPSVLPHLPVPPNVPAKPPSRA